MSMSDILNNPICQATIPNPEYDSNYDPYNSSGYNPQTLPNPSYNETGCNMLLQQQYTRQNAAALAATATPSANPYADNNLTGTDAALQWLDNLADKKIDGEVMPQFELNKIQGLRCPPPLEPTVANAQLQLLNQQMQTQNNQLSNIVKQIALIKSIYKTQFQMNSVSVYDETANNIKPQLIITGSLPNPQLSFIIQPANQGMPGRDGGAGPPGNAGGSGLSGIQGNTGYWGSQGYSVL